MLNVQTISNFLSFKIIFSIFSHFYCCLFRSVLYLKQKTYMNGENMFVYKDVLNQLSKMGYSACRIRREKILSSATLDNIRKGKSVSLKTLDTICRLLKCQLSDIVEIKHEEYKDNQ